MTQTSFPPHLPPPSCSVPQHRQLSRLKYIVFVVCLSVFAGMAGTAIFMGWVWPNVVGDVGLVSGGRGVAGADVENRVGEKLKDKMYTVYRRSALAPTGSGVVVSSEDRLVTAVSALSSGWLVTYLPAYDGRFRDWVVLGESGGVYRVGKVLFDRRTNIAFVELAPGAEGAVDSFRVAAFSPVRNNQRLVALLPGGPKGLTVRTSGAPLFTETHLDSLPATGLGFVEELPAGTFVADEDGVIVGVINTQGALLPSEIMSGFFVGLTEREKMMFPSLGVEGFHTDVRPLIEGNSRPHGFVVTRVLSSGNSFRRGDIITEINKRSFTHSALWYTTSGERLEVTVLRSGTEIKITATVFQL